MALKKIGEILGYFLVQCTPITSLSLSLDPISSPFPDDYSHHVTYEAQHHDIFWGAPTGFTLHHW